MTSNTPPLEEKRFNQNRFACFDIKIHSLSFCLSCISVGQLLSSASRFSRNATENQLSSVDSAGFIP